MLVNSNILLNNALKEGYAIGAYNINNIEFARFVLETCNEDNCPVILGVSESAIKYFGGEKTVFNVVKSLINDLNINIPVVLHLDHAKSVLSCKKAIDAGFTSVMMDASNLNIEENIKMTNEVIEYASKRNVSVEAEIGEVGSSMLNNSVNASLEDASYFVQRTNVNSLAPSIGNAHGIYNDDVKLDFELLGSICKETKIPLVLHGASGLDENKIKTAIFCGVTKINIDTDLRASWTKGVREFLDKNKNEIDPRKIILSGKDEVIKVIHKKNELFGCKNKAN